MERTRRILIDQLLPLGLVYAPDESTEEIRRNASNHVLSAGCVFPWSARENTGSSLQLRPCSRRHGFTAVRERGCVDIRLRQTHCALGDQSTIYGLTTLFRGVLYEDYVKIDYSV